MANKAENLPSCAVPKRYSSTLDDVICVPDDQKPEHYARLKQIFKDEKFVQTKVAERLDVSYSSLRHPLSGHYNTYEEEGKKPSARIVERDGTLRRLWIEALREKVFSLSEDEWAKLFHKKRGHLDKAGVDVGIPGEILRHILEQRFDAGGDVFALLAAAAQRASDELNDDVQDKALDIALNGENRDATRASLKILELGGIGEDRKIRRRDERFGQFIQGDVNILSISGGMPTDKEIQQLREINGLVSGQDSRGRGQIGAGAGTGDNPPAIEAQFVEVDNGQGDGGPVEDRPAASAVSTEPENPAGEEGHRGGQDSISSVLFEPAL
jgi:hypothetical protein